MKPGLVWADPDPELLDLYERAFTRWGFDVRTATDAQQCLTCLRDHETHALVLDCELLWGGADGLLDLLGDAQGHGTERPVIVLVGDESQALARQFELPADHCLRKPFRLQDVRDRFEMAGLFLSAAVVALV
jgi:DNA-binding response OmpR family regulator